MSLTTCSQCTFGKLMPQKMSHRQCMGVPPTPVALPVGPGQMGVQMVHPVVEASMESCGLYRPRVFDTTEFEHTLDGKS
jgi:hypothetical protein